MSVIILLVSFSLLVALGFLIAFIYNVKSGQFDDHHTPPLRMLMDEHDGTDNNKTTTNT